MMRQEGSPLLYPEQQADELYEGAIKAMANWLVETGAENKSWGVLGGDTLAERRLFIDGKNRPIKEAIDIDDNKIPGTWQVVTGSSGKPQTSVIRPLAPANHIYLAIFWEDEPISIQAAEGLINRVPGLNILLERSGFSKGEAAFPIAAAALPSLINAERIEEGEPALWAMVGCSIPFLPIFGAVWVAGKIKSFCGRRKK